MAISNGQGVLGLFTPFLLNILMRSRGDGGLGHGDAPAGLEGVYGDGPHRGRRLRRPSGAADEGGEEGSSLLHGHGLLAAAERRSRWCTQAEADRGDEDARN